jgi:transposase
MYERCAGLDVHKKTVVACRRRLDEGGQEEREVKTFGTMTGELLALGDWLGEWEIEQVVMESTGEYWKPIYNLLEGNFGVMLVNARHVKQVPGRKTDVLDAEWLAELLSYGLLRASYVPAKPQRELRELTRYRVKVVQERARVVNRVQKVLESANVKLASVVSDVLGVSGKQMLAAMVAGQTDPEALASLAKGRLRNKMAELAKALHGQAGAHHRFLLGQHLAHLDFLEGQVALVNTEIAERIEDLSQPPAPSESDNAASASPAGDEGTLPLTWNEAVTVLDTAPGIGQRAAQTVLAEIGIEMAQFPTADHLTSWAGLAPGNHQSANKRYSGRTTKGNQTLRPIMIEIAWAAVRTKGTYLKALYHRLARRRGKKRAIVAVARSLLVSIYHMLSKGEPYQDLGYDYFDQRKKEVKADHLVRQLTKLGYTVQLEAQTLTPAGA